MYKSFDTSVCMYKSFDTCMDISYDTVVDDTDVDDTDDTYVCIC
jgi:hypothetical protein